ncbi:unnamed protein product [Durusdinium trenchii]|uniref:Uncharacterized protein n=2 Tax=Durusdinium trenchii TaxID=1381693 RepID=A0ABP0SGX7_9DINO
MLDTDRTDRSTEREPLVAPTSPSSSGSCFWKSVAVLIVLVILLAPVVSVILAFPFLTGLSFQSSLAIALGVPLLGILILIWPVSVFDPEPYDNVGVTQFTILGVTMTYQNYFRLLVSFMYAASTTTWRSDYGKWFEDIATEDKSIGSFANSKLYYSHQSCKEKLQQLGSRISSGTAWRESQLALGFFNNLSWPEAGRMSLGLKSEDHAFVRPFLAEMFGSSSWTPASLRSQFRGLFAEVSVLDHNNRTGHRGSREPFFPSLSKNIVTQWTVKILHKVALDIDLTDSEMQDLAALQTVNLVVAGATSRVARMFLMWAFFTNPNLITRARFIAKYRPFIRKRWPNVEWTNKKLDLLSSVFLDAVMFAGGRSVPVSIDLVMGYILTKNKPESILGVDFKQEENVRRLMMEAMRFHPLVTTLPYWVKSPDTATGQGKWEPEAVCIDRALADPSIFEDPDIFKLDRPGQGSTESGGSSNSIAWGEFACVDGKKDHPYSYCCPGKDLSINMVVAFVLEYFAAGPWTVEDEDIAFDYYGTANGFKCTKIS